MIDCNLYKENENIAKREVNNWRTMARNNIDIFEKVGFPVRINNIAHLRQLVDTMNENGFDSFMQELNGLTDIELNMLVVSIENSLRFQQIYFPNHEIIIPFDNMMKSLVLYTKLTKLEFSNVLEIGSGSGIFSFFISIFFVIFINIIFNK